MMVETRNLRKEYNGVVAVKNLSLGLERGDVLALVGPNGAGKTTTIKMLATLVEPTSGTALIDGVDVRKSPEEVRSLIGYMPDFFGVYNDVQVWEYLGFFAAAYRVPRSQRRAAIDGALELTNLTSKSNAYAESLSRGMKQRLCLARALLHDPKVLLLDEPASGLDPRARVELKELLQELRGMGKTVIVSSHVLPELEDFCNKVAIIERGELLLVGDMRELVQQVGKTRRFRVRVAADNEGAVRLLEAVPGVQAVGQSDDCIEVLYAGPQDEQHALLTALVQNGYRVLSFAEQESDLEQVFLSVTKGDVS